MFEDIKEYCTSIRQDAGIAVLKPEYAIDGMRTLLWRNDKWVTINGAHVLIDKSNRIRSGMGGKFKGMPLNMIGRKKYKNTSYRNAKKVYELAKQANTKKFKQEQAKKEQAAYSAYQQAYKSMSDTMQSAAKRYGAAKVYHGSDAPAQANKAIKDMTSKLKTFTNIADNANEAITKRWPDKAERQKVLQANREIYSKITQLEKARKTAGRSERKQIDDELGRQQKLFAEAGGRQVRDFDIYSKSVAEMRTELEAQKKMMPLYKSEAKKVSKAYDDYLKSQESDERRASDYVAARKKHFDLAAHERRMATNPNYAKTARAKAVEEVKKAVDAFNFAEWARGYNVRHTTFDEEWARRKALIMQGKKYNPKTIGENLQVDKRW